MITLLKLFSENKNFRVFLFFSTFANIGLGMFGIFMMWAVHALYQNPFYTGIAGVMAAAPTIANFIVGPLVDRRSKVSLMKKISAGLFCATALLLAAALLTVPPVWFLFIVMLAINALSMFYSPAVTAYMPRIVSGDELIKANAMLSIVGITTGLAVGLLLFFTLRGGAAAAVTNFETAYAFMAGFFLAAFTTSFFVRDVERKEADAAPISERVPLRAYFSELKEGLVFIKSGLMLLIVVTLVFQDIFATAAYVNLPMFAQIHSGEATGYIILSALGLLGGLIGSYISRILAPKFEVWKILVGCFIAAGIARIMFVHIIADDFRRSLWIVLLYVGLGSTIGMLFGTLLQKLPPKRMIARVGTIVTSILGVTSVLGAFLGGIAGTRLPNVDMVFNIHGISYIIIGICLCLSKRIRSLPKIGEVGENK